MIVQPVFIRQQQPSTVLVDQDAAVVPVQIGRIGLQLAFQLFQNYFPKYLQEFLCQGRWPTPGSMMPGQYSLLGFVCSLRPVRIF